MRVAALSSAATASFRAPATTKQDGCRRSQQPCSAPLMQPAAGSALCRRRQRSPSVRASAGGTSPGDPFNSGPVRSPLFESEVFRQEMDSLNREMAELNRMISKFSDFDLEGKKLFVDNMERLGERVALSLKRIELADDPVGNEMLRQHRAQMLQASTNWNVILDGLKREVVEMRKLIEFEEQTADPAALAMLKAQYKQRFEVSGNMRIDEIMRDPEAAMGAMDPQAMKACTDVMDNPANIEKYKDNRNLYKFLQKVFPNA